MNLHCIVKRVGILVFLCSMGIAAMGQATLVINPTGGTSTLLNDGLKIQITTDATVHVYRQNLAQYYSGMAYPTTNSYSAVQTRFCFEQNGIYNLSLQPFIVCATTPAVQNGNSWTASMSGYVISSISGAIFHVTMNFSYTHPDHYFAIDYIVRAPASLPGGAEIVHLYLDHDAFILGFDASRGMRTVNATGELVGDYRIAGDGPNLQGCAGSYANQPVSPSSHGFKTDGVGFRSFYTGQWSSRMGWGPLNNLMLTNTLNTSSCIDDGVAVEFVTPALSAGQSSIRRVLHCYGDTLNEFDNTVVGSPIAPGLSTPVTVDFTTSAYNETEGSTTHTAATIKVTVSGGILSQAQTLTMSAYDATAVQNTDYTYVAGFVIPAGNYTTAQTLTLNNINIVGNTTCDGNRSFTINILPNNCNDLIVPGITTTSATVAIVEDDLPAVNQPSNLTYCAGASVPTTTFTGNTVTGGTYSWSATNAANIGLSPSSGTDSIPSFTAQNPTNSLIISTVTVTPTAGMCSGTAKTFTITVNPKPFINAKTTTVCSGSAFTVIPANGVGSDIVPMPTTYTWAVSTPNANIAGATSQLNPQNSISQILTNTSNTAQNVIYTVMPTYGNCNGSTFTVTVTVNPTPTISNKTATICSGSTFTVTPSHGVNGDIIPAGTTYTWTVPTNSVGATSQATAQTSISQMLTNTSSPTQNVIYTVTATSGSCTSTFTITVTVNNFPALNTDITGPHAVCVGNTIQLTNATTGGVWTVNNSNAAIANPNVNPEPVTGAAAGNAYVTYTLSNGQCETRKTFLLKVVPATAPNIKIGFEE